MNRVLCRWQASRPELTSGRHPKGVRAPQFGVDVRTGVATLTSTNAPGVAQVLFAEADVRAKPGLAPLAFELTRPRAVALTFVEWAADLPDAARAAFVAPAQSNEGEGLRLSFLVVDEDQVVAWKLDLTPTTGRLTTRPVATGAP